jgi:site-specific DNA-methyltransferase (adenine-specific)
MGYQVINGDCLTVMYAELEDNSIDAIVTDPPYGLSVHKPEHIAAAVAAWLAGEVYTHKGKGFMGKSWDAFVPGPEVWREAMRVLKPGGHMAVFAGSRTVDLMGLSLRLAGLEIRDQLSWIYAQGFPKSLDVSKAIDKAAGAEREVVGSRAKAGDIKGGAMHAGSNVVGVVTEIKETTPATDAAKQWDGWGTALKPAHEPIILARKPLVGTVAANVLEHGTGGINVDACRIGTNEDTARPNGSAGIASPGNALKVGGGHNEGRWPANVIMDEEAGAILDAQSGFSKPKSKRVGRMGGDRDGLGMGAGGDAIGIWPEDLGGGASRFFYCAKTGKKEREAGLTGENMLCSCHESELQKWLELDQNQSTASERAPLAPRGTTESHETVGRSWPTDGTGSSITGDQSRPDMISTTSTETSSTTGSKTCDSSTEQPTSESTQGASLEAGSGSSPVQSVSKKSRLEKSIGTSAKRDGRCMEDVGRATSQPSSEVKGIAVCRLCGRWCTEPSSANVTGGRAEGSDGLKSPRAGSGRTSSGRLNIHSTVKPISLMSWLCKLITPPGGLILDPFTGSGSTGCAAVQEGFSFIGCELSEEYARIARARIEHWSTDK